MASSSSQPPRGPLTRGQIQAQLQAQGGRRISKSGSFAQVPSQRFWTRLFVPSFLIFVFGFFLMGSFSILSRMQFNSTVREQDPTRSKHSSMLPHKAALQQIQEFTDSVTHIPDVCWSGQASNDFQRQQCHDFWNSLLLDGVLAILPFLMLAVYLMAAFDSIGRVYLRVRKQIAQGLILFGGTVTRPPTMKNDFFGWFFCLRSLVVQLPNKTQVRVYIPLSENVPEPGSEISIYGGQKKWRSVRFFGVYAPPNVQVVQGS